MSRILMAAALVVVVPLSATLVSETLGLFFATVAAILLKTLHEM